MSTLEQMREEDFIEKAAAMEHERWSQWQSWVHRSTINIEEGYVIQKANYDRWERQINTPYKKLSEKEKESDRHEVRKYLPLIHSLLEQDRIQIREELMKWAKDNMKDEHPMEDGVPVETYGYEETHNRVLSDLITHLSEKK